MRCSVNNYIYVIFQYLLWLTIHFRLFGIIYVFSPFFFWIKKVLNCFWRSNVLSSLSKARSSLIRSSAFVAGKTVPYIVCHRGHFTRSNTNDLSGNNLKINSNSSALKTSLGKCLYFKYSAKYFHSTQRYQRNLTDSARSRICRYTIPTLLLEPIYLVESWGV